MRQIMESFMRDHYKKWMDEPIPALLGLTPREAAKTSEGKARLEVLLEDLEDLVPGTGHFNYQVVLFTKMHFAHAFLGTCQESRSDARLPSVRLGDKAKGRC